MLVILSSMIFFYVGMVILSAKKVVVQMEYVCDQQILEVKSKLEEQQRLKLKSMDEKSKLENHAMEIFTLYEMTSEITKSLHETKAFEIFKQTLTEHVRYEECLYLDPMDANLDRFKKDGQYFMFQLLSKRRKLGFLAVKGLNHEDHEKFTILAHQFALALRRVKLYQEIEKIAITDSLTNVYTRRHVLERFQDELRRAKVRHIKTSFLMIDVDHFKKYNDNYGHLAGDQILSEIGQIIRQNIREIDVAGRYGGEEFCVILPDTDRKGAKYAAERIRKATQQAVIQAYDTTISARLSIGISTAPDDGKSPDELIDKADWALYRAKKIGRNCVCSFGVYENGQI